eukprot:6201974-Pleurochrysis_carterae.AAC.3
MGSKFRLNFYDFGSYRARPGNWLPGYLRTGLFATKFRWLFGNVRKRHASMTARCLIAVAARDSTLPPPSASTKRWLRSAASRRVCWSRRPCASPDDGGFDVPTRRYDDLFNTAALRSI